MGPSVKSMRGDLYHFRLGGGGEGALNVGKRP